MGGNKMGTDIHCYVEYLYSNDWRYYTKLDIHRSYALFGCLVDGLRGWKGFAPIGKRDLPGNLSVSVNDFYNWGKGDFHSCGFIYYQELPTIKSAYKKAMKVVYDNDVESYKSTFEKWKKPDEEFVLPDYLSCGFDAYLKDKIKKHNAFFDIEFYGYYILDEELPNGVQDIRLVFWFDN